jgi:hypothetical protein
LGVCTTKLKQTSRKNGISRWPYRKLTAIENKLQKLQDAITHDPSTPGIHSEMESLRKQKTLIFEKANSFNAFPMEAPPKPQMTPKMKEPKPSFSSKMNLAKDWVRCPETTQGSEIRKASPTVNSPQPEVTPRIGNQSGPFESRLGYPKYGVEWSQSASTQPFLLQRSTPISRDQTQSVPSPNIQTTEIPSAPSFLRRPQSVYPLETTDSSQLLSEGSEALFSTEVADSTNASSLGSTRPKIFLQNTPYTLSDSSVLPLSPTSPNTVSMTSSSFLRAFNSFTFDNPPICDSSGALSSTQTLAQTQTNSNSNSESFPDISSPFPCKRHFREFKVESPLFHKRFHQTQPNRLPECSLFSLEVDDFLGLEEPNNTLSSFDLAEILSSYDENQQIQDEKEGGSNIEEF